MEADSRREGVEGVREPLVEVVRGGGEWGRGDMEALDRVLQVHPIGFILHGSGGGGLVGRRGEVDEDRDVI